jgi:telomerase protein component 1
LKWFSYPSNEVEFTSSRLPGNFDPERAGKRMKLATPETWETQLAK